ncbi:MAG: T9SS type A sorting domain-containing protein [Bacteroidetes bacterium]|nr:T9SS type A sorting domain-containing protein [Bacteroidota bacterium]
MKNFLLFFLLAGVVSSAGGQVIEEAEYFIGSDPGEGNGISLLLKDGLADGSLESLSATVETGALSTGPAVLYIRVKKSDGSWSAPVGQVIMINSAPDVDPSAYPVLASAEIFSGSDPGEGNGTALSVASSSYSMATTSLEADGLPTGPSVLSVRFQKAGGDWSDPVRQVILVSEALKGASANYSAITQAEYFIGTDPGEGSGQALSAKDEAFSHPAEAVTANLSTTVLSAGSYRLGLRVKNDLNDWSEPLYQVMSVSDSTVIPMANRLTPVTGAEVFSGTDPGEGSGMSLTETITIPTGVFASFSGSLVVPDAPTGLIPVSVRFKTGETDWGTPVTVGMAAYKPTGDILVTWEDPVSRDSLAHALNYLGHHWDEFDRTGQPTLSLSGWKTIIWDERDFLTATQRDSLESFLLNNTESTLILSGEDVASYHDHGRAFSDSTFLRQTLKARLRFEDGGTGKAALPGRLIHDGYVDSVEVNTPDVIRPVYGSQTTIAWQTLTKPDSAYAIAYDGAYNVSFSTFSWSGFRTGLTGHLDRILSWVTGSGGSLPVELTSFTGSMDRNGVTLNWTTASEVNNYGWEVQRFLPDPEGLEGTGRNLSETDPSRTSGSVSEWKTIGFVAGSGTTNSPKSYSFQSLIATHKSLFRLKQLDLDGSVSYSGILELEAPMPDRFMVHQNYPNPFNPSTTIPVDVPTAGKLTLQVFNLLGQQVFAESQDLPSGGFTKLVWNASSGQNGSVASGLYFYRIHFRSQAGTTHQSGGSMVLMK